MQSTSRSPDLAKRAAEVLLCLWILTFSIGVTKFGAFPIKTLLFIFFAATSVYLLTKQGHITIQHRWGLLILFIWLLVSANIGFINGFDSSTLNQGSSLVATVLMVVFSFLLYENTSLSLERIKRSIYLSAGLGVATKAILGLGVVFGFFSADGIDAVMQNYAGSSSFHADEYGGFMGLLPRIGNAGDLFNLVVFLYYIRTRNGARVAFAWLLTLGFVLVTYSRYLILAFLIATLYASGSNIRNRSKATMILLSVILLAAIVRYTEADVIYLEFEERFTGYTQSRSDSIREEMKEFLFNSFNNSPVFGIGLGGYVRDYLRSPTMLWQYELEYLSLLMQLGIVGFILIVANFTAYVFRMVISGHQKAYVIPTTISLLFWIGTPIQSSLFSGTQSAMIILSIFFLSREDKEEDAPRNIQSNEPGRLENQSSDRVQQAASA